MDQARLFDYDDVLFGLVGLDPGARVARLETMVMVEWLDDDRPDWREATWTCNVPAGPDTRGIAALQAWQREFGACHVTTGNPQPLTMDHHGEVGIYVREDVLEPNENFLRAYLSGSLDDRRGAVRLGVARQGAARQGRHGSGGATAPLRQPGDLL